MKKVLLLFISLIILAPAVQAYQTVLVNFPYDQGWHNVYYGKRADEAILQYTPRGQNAKNWTRTLIFFFFKNPQVDDLNRFENNLTAQMEAINSSSAFTTIKDDENDMIKARCVSKRGSYPAQCEILRVTNSFEGFITMQYINKNISNFKSTYDQWLGIVRDIRIYYSYYMDERILNKATSFHI